MINSNQIHNLYNYIMKMREKNKALLIKISNTDLMRIELNEKTHKIKESEEHIKILQFENK